MAGKIIADIIEAPYDAIRMNVANVTVLTANSSGLTFVPTGNVNVTIGGANANLTMNILTANGIKFPATQVSSSDGNTLDDYEEGTWTPVVTAGAINGAGKVYVGRYTKIGRQVTITFLATATDSNLQVTSYVAFSGLPFAAQSNGAGAVSTEDIDFYARNGFCLTDVNTNFYLSACGSAGGTNTLYASLSYFAAT